MAEARTKLHVPPAHGDLHAGKHAERVHSPRVGRNAKHGRIGAAEPGLEIGSELLRAEAHATGDVGTVLQAEWPADRHRCLKHVETDGACDRTAGRKNREATQLEVVGGDRVTIQARQRAERRELARAVTRASALVLEGTVTVVEPDRARSAIRDGDAIVVEKHRTPNLMELVEAVAVGNADTQHWLHGERPAFARVPRGSPALDDLDSRTVATHRLKRVRHTALTAK